MGTAVNHVFVRPQAMRIMRRTPDPNNPRRETLELYCKHSIERAIRDKPQRSVVCPICAEQGVRI